MEKVMFADEIEIYHGGTNILDVPGEPGKTRSGGLMAHKPQAKIKLVPRTIGSSFSDTRSPKPSICFQELLHAVLPSLTVAVF